MQELREISSHRSFGGWQRVVEHPSTAVGGPMRFGVFLPPAAESSDCPVLYYLSGLTCTEQNAITKAWAQRACAEHSLILITPDTSPRGAHVADDEGWDLGMGAGFYVDATQEPWAPHYRMASYVTEELPALMQQFSGSGARGITGHSMGGHGALVLALRNPKMYRSVSAFAPIVSPAAVPWGQKAFAAYLGKVAATWNDWDATALLASRGALADVSILIDQGDADPFLAEQLDATAFRAAAEASGQSVNYRLQSGYDHSYYFVASFIAEHVAHHAHSLR